MRLNADDSDLGNVIEVDFRNRKRIPERKELRYRINLIEPNNYDNQQIRYDPKYDIYYVRNAI